MRFPRWVLALLALGACGPADYIHCRELCHTRQDCVDPNLDVDGCAANCADRVERDADYQRRADDCWDCQFGRSCAEDVDCRQVCAGVP